MRLLRLFVATLCLAALGLAALPAHAAGVGTLTFSPPTWRNRAADRLIDKLNRKDCNDDAIASFSVSIRNATGTFEVWSGAGCDMAANRVASAVNKTCVRVSGKDLTPIDTRVELHVRDMVAAYGTEPTAGIEECDASQSAGLQTRSLYFIVFDANTNNSTVTAQAPWKFNYDVTPPPPPSSVTAGSGDETLVTTFVAPTGETNLLHYHFYCSPIGPAPVKNTGGTAGTAGADTAGTAGTAGTDTAGTAGTEAVTNAGAGAASDTGGTTGATGGTSGATGGTGATAGTAGTTTTEAAAGADSATLDPSCTSSTLIPGEYPPAGAMDCGVIGAQGAKGGETNPVLDNDTPYAVAIATEDNVNNIGKLSGLACNIPKDITGFYEAYTEAGGQAGGGYCTFAPAHRDSVAFGLLLVAAACAFVRRRR